MFLIAAIVVATWTAIERIYDDRRLKRAVPPDGPSG
jgi:hypothetical protein